MHHWWNSFLFEVAIDRAFAISDIIVFQVLENKNLAYVSKVI